MCGPRLPLTRRTASTRSLEKCPLGGQQGLDAIDRPVYSAALMQPLTKDLGTRERLLEAGAQAIAAKSFNACGLTEILALAEKISDEGSVSSISGITRSTTWCSSSASW